MTQETKEWKRERDFNESITKVYTEDGLIADCYKHAKLIASAPDLLEACKKAYKQFYGVENCTECGRSTDNEVIKLLEKAINKAESEG